MNQDVTFGRQTCIECGKSLSGRIDKKFCDDQCRATFNNRQQRAHERLINTTNRQLRKNRTILKKLCPTGKATIRKSVLSDLGFDFSLSTTTYVHRQNSYYFVYEYGFMAIVDQKGIRKVVIIQQQPYMENKFDPWL